MVNESQFRLFCFVTSTALVEIITFYSTSRIFVIGLFAEVMSELLLSSFSITVFTVCASIYFITISGTGSIHILGYLIVMSNLWQNHLMRFSTFGTSIFFVTISCAGCVYCFRKFYSFAAIRISASQFTGLCKMIPQITNCDPSRLHITVCIKVIPFRIDFFPFVCWIGTICILIPPASVVFLPISGCLCLPWNVDSIRIHIIDATVYPFICCHCSTGVKIVPGISKL